MVSTNSSARSCDPAWDMVSDGAKQGQIAGFAIVMVVSLIGNLLVILVVYKNKNMRKTINYFIVNMAVSDMIVPLFVMPYLITRISVGKAWQVQGPVGLALCKIVMFLADIPGPVSILTLVCMAVDRFVGVVFPLHAGVISNRARKGMIFTTWFIAAGVYAPYLYALKLIEYPPKSGIFHCKFVWTDDRAQHQKSHQIFSTIQSVVFFIIPLILLVLLYGTILITLAKRKFPRLHQSTEAQQRNRRVSRSATVIAFTVVLVFQFCWGPFNTIMFLWAFKWNWDYPKFCGWRAIYFSCQFLTWAYTAINPCVYFILIENYRKGLRTVLPRTLSVNSSQRAQRSTKQETQEAIDCIELVEQ